MPRRRLPPSSSVVPRKNRRSRTKFWHTPAVILLEATAPYSHELVQEVHLRRQPQRIDLLILKRIHSAAEEITHLEALYSRLGDVNLIELKGGTDQVERLDVHTLLGYASQLRVSIDRPPRRASNVQEQSDKAARFLDILPGAELRLIVLAPLLQEAFLAEVHRMDGQLTQVSTGVWEGRLAGYTLIFLETERVWETSQGNRLFYALTRGVIEGPERLGLLTEREEEVYIEVMEWLLGQPPVLEGGIHMRMEKIREYQARQLARKMDWLNSLPPEDRLVGLKPEDRLKGLKPEDRLKGLKPEDRLKGLPPEELVRSLSDEARRTLARLLQESPEGEPNGKEPT